MYSADFRRRKLAVLLLVYYGDGDTRDFFIRVGDEAWLPEQMVADESLVAALDETLVAHVKDATASEWLNSDAEWSRPHNKESDNE